MTARLVVIARGLPDGCPFTLLGREAWALLELSRDGSKGCTPLDNPGPRWSAYVHVLRHEYGLDIETLHETHKGQFPGNHARYILKSDVEILSRSDQPDARAA